MSQCTATAKRTGERCQLDAIRGAKVCHVHGGSTPQVKKKARERLAEDATDAASSLIRAREIVSDLIDEDGDPDEVKALASELRKLAESVLDRAGEDGAPKVRRQELTGEDGGAVKAEIEHSREATETAAEAYEALRKLSTAEEEDDTTGDG